MDYQRYSVSKRHKEPLLNFVTDSLRACGCIILRTSDPVQAPFRITFEDATGQRHGIIVYAFFANSQETRNRPSDEHRFQIKYGKKDGDLHRIWQDPYQIYTTLLVGIDTERGVFVGIDPVLHELTKFFISIEFKRADVESIQDKSWHCWERTRRAGDDAPVETLVGGTATRFLSYVKFEQAARGLDQGHRFLLAEKLEHFIDRRITLSESGNTPQIQPNKAHELAKEFEIGEEDILNLIQAAPRLKMAVRGWVAERHLERILSQTVGVDSCIQLEEDGRPDFEVIYKGSRPFLLECKNVLRKTMADGTIRVDFQKTRASKTNPCSRFYRPSDFHILAACLHPCTERWEFVYQLTMDMEFHTKKCPEHLSSNVKIADGWLNDPAETFERLLA